MLRTMLVVLLVLVGSARADLTDPSDIHLFSSTSFAQGSGGVDWVTLPTFNGSFSVEDVSNKSVDILPWNIVIAIPNQTGVLADTITMIGTTSVNLSPGPEAILTSGSAYDALGVSGADNSVSFINFNIAETALGLPAATSFGLNDYSITGIGLLNQTALGVQLSGLLPAGSIIFAYGTNSDGALYDTAFTNTGVVSTLAVSTPEPSSLVIAGLSAMALIGYSRYKK